MQNNNIKSKFDLALKHHKENNFLLAEKLYRKDYKYDLIIPINYNTKNTKLGKGSAIFLHLTKNYLPTSGCVALNKKDFMILLKIIYTASRYYDW